MVGKTGSSFHFRYETFDPVVDLSLGILRVTGNSCSIGKSSLATISVPQQLRRWFSDARVSAGKPRLRSKSNRLSIASISVPILLQICERSSGVLAASRVGVSARILPTRDESSCAAKAVGTRCSVILSKSVCTRWKLYIAATVASTAKPLMTTNASRREARTPKRLKSLMVQIRSSEPRK